MSDILWGSSAGKSGTVCTSALMRGWGGVWENNDRTQLWLVNLSVDQVWAWKISIHNFRSFWWIYSNFKDLSVSNSHREIVLPARSSPMRYTAGWIPWQKCALTSDCKSWCHYVVSAWIWIVTMWQSDALKYVITFFWLSVKQPSRGWFWNNPCINVIYGHKSKLMIQSCNNFLGDIINLNNCITRNIFKIPRGAIYITRWH